MTAPKKRGRPPSEGKTRERRVELMLSDAEHARFEAAAMGDGLPLATWCRVTLRRVLAAKEAK